LPGSNAHRSFILVKTARSCHFSPPKCPLQINDLQSLSNQIKVNQTKSNLEKFDRAFGSKASLGCRIQRAEKFNLIKAN